MYLLPLEASSPLLSQLYRSSWIVFLPLGLRSLFFPWKNPLNWGTEENLKTILRVVRTSVKSKSRFLKSPTALPLAGPARFTLGQSTAQVGWHHRLDGHESEQALGVGDGQGRLVCCSPRGRKESDTTERLNWTELKRSMSSAAWLQHESRALCPLTQD